MRRPNFGTHRANQVGSTAITTRAAVSTAIAYATAGTTIATTVTYATTRATIAHATADRTIAYTTTDRTIATTVTYATTRATIAHATAGTNAALGCATTHNDYLLRVRHTESAGRQVLYEMSPATRTGDRTGHHAACTAAHPTAPATTRATRATAYRGTACACGATGTSRPGDASPIGGERAGVTRADVVSVYLAGGYSGCGSLAHYANANTQCCPADAVRDAYGAALAHASASTHHRTDTDT